MNRLDVPPSEVPEEEAPSTFSEFPPESSQSVSGLAWLGYLTDMVFLYGHEFSIRTLRMGEELQVGILTKRYSGTLGEDRAVAAATVALALTSVDGDGEFCPAASKDSTAQAEARFRYVIDNWYGPPIQELFEKYIRLAEKQRDALQRVEDLSSGSLSTFIPSPDSLTEKEDSEVPLETEEDMQAIADLAEFNEDS